MRSFIFAVLSFASQGVAKAEPVTLDAFVQTETDAAIELVYGRVGLNRPEFR